MVAGNPSLSPVKGSNGKMLNKRQHLQQQYLIYGVKSDILPMRSYRCELLRQSELPALKRLSKEQLATALLPASHKGSNNNNNSNNNSNNKTPSASNGLQNSTPPNKNSTSGASQKNSESKSLFQRTLELRSVYSVSHKSTKSDSCGKNFSSSDKDNALSGRKARKPRQPLYVPPINLPTMPVPRNVVTIDTSKARGNTDVVRLVAKDLGWREFSMGRRDQGCDVIWNAVSFFDQPEVFSGRVNKFPGSLEIFHKVTLFRQLMLMKQLFPDDYNFFPLTWVLPAQFHQFSNDVRQMLEKKIKPKPTFIIKPSEGSQGEGIYLVRDPHQYVTQGTRTHVAQEYLSHVLLIDGFKFDLRVYCLLRRLDPLEVHICNEGLARFSTVQYEKPTKKNLNETYMHLTNYSLNKRSATFNKSEKEDEGSKRKMTSVFKLLEHNGHDTTKLWAEIESIVCKTLVAVAGELKIEYQAALPSGKVQPSCFQVLGFDILILDNLKPILLEVNSNPSLSITSEHEVSPGVFEYMTSAKDEDVKRTLIRDTLILMAPQNKYTRNRRKRWRRQQQQPEPPSDSMEVDSSSNPGSPVAETWHHRKHRERDITIRFEDGETGLGARQKSIFEDGETGLGARQKSIFAESDKPRPTYQRQETCRVFVEGEGEITHFPTPPYYHHREMDSSQNARDSNKDGNEMERPSAEASTEDEGGQSVPPMPFELSSVESGSDDESEEESCLKEILPAIYAEEIRHMRVCERMADIFLRCLGIKGCLRMGPTAFRMFSRKCRLTRKGLNSASIDILYIDMQRKWDFINPDRTTGLCFQGFVDACMEIARRIFASCSQSEMLERFISYCEDSFKRRMIFDDDENEDDDDRREQISARIIRHQQRSITYFPRRTITSIEEEEAKDFIGSTMLKRHRTVSVGGKPKAVSDVDDYMRDMRNKTYVPSVLTVIDTEQDSEGE